MSAKTAGPSGSTLPIPVGLDWIIKERIRARLGVGLNILFAKPDDVAGPPCVRDDVAQSVVSAFRFWRWYHGTGPLRRVPCYGDSRPVIVEDFYVE